MNVSERRIVQRKMKDEMNGRDGEGKRTIKCQSADKVRVRNIHASVVLPLSDSDLSMKTLSVNYSLT